jgi:hypothetical protein
MAAIRTLGTLTPEQAPEIAHAARVAVVRDPDPAADEDRRAAIAALRSLGRPRAIYILAHATPACAWERR